MDWKSVRGMKKTFRILGTAFLLLWQFPQLVFGLVIAAALCPWLVRARRDRGTLWIGIRLRIGVSFGPLIFLHENTSCGSCP
jgi:hypothetical protein